MKLHGSLRKLPIPVFLMACFMAWLALTPGDALGQDATAVVPYYQSTLDNSVYEVRQPDPLTMVLYSADGTIVGTMRRKKATDKFKGQTDRLARGCPNGRGKLEVRDMTESIIKMRVETAEGERTPTCLLPLLAIWVNYELIRVPPDRASAIASSRSRTATPGLSERREAASGQSADATRRGAGTSTLPAPNEAGQSQSGSTEGPRAQGPGAPRQISDPIEVRSRRPSAREEMVFHTFLPYANGLTYSGVAMDSQGHIYLGFVCSGYVGIAKMDRSGKFFHYRTTITDGPKNDCQSNSSRSVHIATVRLGKDGRIYVAGTVQSAMLFPTKNAVRPRPREAGSSGSEQGTEGFLARFSADGRTVEYATLWGGIGNDEVNSIAVDESGGVWVVGRTGSKDFPRISPIMDFAGQMDAFVTYFDPQGKPRFSTTIGTPDSENAQVVALGNGYVLMTLESNRDSLSASLSTTTDRLLFSKLQQSPFGGAGELSFAWLVRIGMAAKRIESIRPLRGFPSSMEVFRDDTVFTAGFGHHPTGRKATADDNTIAGGFLWKHSPDLARYDYVTLNWWRRTEPNRGMATADMIQTAIRTDGTAFSVGLSDAYWSVPGWPKARLGREGPQIFLVKHDPDGTAVWSSSLGAMNNYDRAGVGVLFQGYYYPPYQTGGLAVATNGDEVVALAVARGSAVPTSADALIGEGPQSNRDGRNDQPNEVAVLAKFRTSSEDARACRHWTRPLSLYVTNQGGQDFNPWVVANRADCVWKVSSPDSWIRVKPIESTKGIGLLKVDIESNYDDRRVGKIIVSGDNSHTFELPVIQSTIPLQVSLSRALVEFPSRRAGASVVEVKAEPDTVWAISTSAEWIRIEGPTERKGPGQVTLKTTPNDTGAPRSASVVVGSQRMSIVQGVEDIPAEGETEAKPGTVSSPPKPVAAPKPSTRPAVKKAASAK